MDLLVIIALLEGQMALFAVDLSALAKAEIKQLVQNAAYGTYLCNELIIGRHGGHLFCFQNMAILYLMDAYPSTPETYLGQPPRSLPPVFGILTFVA
jgi:hypothetical protein